jgi:hypothetical protein
MIELSKGFLMLHFEIGKGGLAAGAPIDDVVTAVNQAFLIEADEHFPNRFGKAFIHGKPLPAPVTGGAQFLKLTDDCSPGLGLPLPDPFNELLPPQGVAVEAFGRELFLDHILSGNSRMVCPRKPEGFITLHPFESNQTILQGIVEGMSDVKHTGHVGGWDYNGVRRPGRMFIGPEITLFFPVRIPFFFNPVGVIRFVQNL